MSALLARDGGTFRLESVFAVTPHPLPTPGNGDSQLLFPLAGDAFISSGFGWRLHPILGGWLMHAGRDFAAPEGTSVVAALSGQVLSSGIAGGYGVAIERNTPGYCAARSMAISRRSMCDPVSRCAWER